jgi:hypothetical protein
MKLQTFSRVFLVILAAYFVGYAMLSAGGAYAPYASIHLGEQQQVWYRWAPLGFYDVKAGQWRRPLLVVAAPLCRADWRWWHGRAGSPEPHYTPDTAPKFIIEK